MKVVDKKIDMVVWFKPDEELIPIKFRLTEDKEQLVIEVNKVIVKDEEKIAGRTIHTFRCQSIINGVEKVYEIRFITNDLRWILFKI
ncbi:hypothetical protein [Brassicibacter mesophilus]|uniref:hypothetical protein n=1 Tax=Brassicibacter mesophilus TaxID=745119 RepID=UPI003D1BC7DE